MPILVDILERREIQVPVKYGITCRQTFPDLEPGDYLDLAFSTSAGIIQLREKDLRTGTLRQLVVQGVELARTKHIVFFVNGEVRMALQEGADGVHLRSHQSIAKARQARREYGVHNFVIGKSVHSITEAVTAEGSLLRNQPRNFWTRIEEIPGLGLVKLAAVATEESLWEDGYMDHDED